MIRDLGETVTETIAEGVGRVVGLAQEQRPLPSDLLESEDAYLVVFDAPGAQPGDVQVRYEENTVHARMDRFRAFHEGFDMVFPGRGLSLEGRKHLPPDAVVDADAASATLRDNGTLEVQLPKDGTMGHDVAVVDEDAAEDGDDADDAAGVDEDAADDGADADASTDTDESS